PIVKAFAEGKAEADYWNNAQTVASGLRVPGAIGDFMILDVLNESEGEAVAVTDEELIRFSKVMAEHTGIFPAPEGGATLAVLDNLKGRCWMQPEDKVVLFNTWSGSKYTDARDRRSAIKQHETEPV